VALEPEAKLLFAASVSVMRFIADVPNQRNVERTILPAPSLSKAQVAKELFLVVPAYDKISTVLSPNISDVEPDPALPG
jgi:hypothetical protein